MLFSLTFRAEFWNISPSIIISLNGVQVAKEDNFLNNQEKTINFEYEIKNLEHKLVIERINKTSKDTVVDNGKIIKDQIIHIKDIVIDHISLESLIDKGIFYPTYEKLWLSQQKNIGITPPSEYNYCKTLYHNGVWKLDFSTPIHVWFFQNINTQI